MAPAIAPATRTTVRAPHRAWRGLTAWYCLAPAAHAAGSVSPWAAPSLPLALFATLSLLALACLGVVLGLRWHRRASADAALRGAILQGTPETVIVTDLERRIRVVNPAFTRLFGYREAEVRGANTRVLYADGADYERVGQTYRERLEGATGDLALLTVRFVARDGRVFHGDTHTDLLRDGSGRHVGY